MVNFRVSRYPAKWICTWGSVTLHCSVLYPGWGMEPGGAGGGGGYKREVVVVVVAGWGGGGVRGVNFCVRQMDLANGGQERCIAVYCTPGMGDIAPFEQRGVGGRAGGREEKKGDKAWWGGGGEVGEGGMVGGGRRVV